MRDRMSSPCVVLTTWTHMGIRSLSGLNATVVSFQFSVTMRRNASHCELVDRLFSAEAFSTITENRKDTSSDPWGTPDTHKGFPVPHCPTQAILLSLKWTVSIWSPYLTHIAFCYNYESMATWWTFNIWAHMDEIWNAGMEYSNGTCCLNTFW